MSVRNSYKHTAAACYIGYITQAAVNIFPPLLFVQFGTEYGTDLVRISLLISINFGTQLLVDLISAKLTDRVSERTLICAAHVFAALGLAGYGVLPELLPDPYAGLVAANVICAIGGGLTEVLISPIIEACPTENKSASMSLLHSFYCWGSVGVTALSTLFFVLFGIGNWHILACVWAVIPFFNIFYFALVPISRLTENGEGMRVRELLKNRTFLLLAVLMICAGASELAMSQWASALAETGLGVTKTVGDLLGPCAFAVLMGTARLFHSKIAAKTDLSLYIGACALLCILSYAVTVFSPIPPLGIIGCALCGFSVGVMWPGTFSRASGLLPKGGTAMFALLALAGDLGCMSGPALAGIVSDASGGDLRKGLATAMIFPALMIAGLLLLRKTGQKNGK
ncbi:MAG: MFS transporter [Ruminiclostridium sp.]|nr:MFS transporter [Ruminiclostridium sp.]